MGIQVEVPSGVMQTRAVLLMCSADLPAKASLTNMKQFNGAYGCTNCEDEGEPRASSHLQRNWPYKAASTLRTHTKMLKCAKEAMDSGTAVSTHNNEL